MSNINAMILNAIDKVFQSKTATIFYDKTFPSTIYGKNEDGTYQIIKDGYMYNVHNGLGTELDVTQNVWVTVPCGLKNLKDMYISAIRKK